MWKLVLYVVFDLVVLVMGVWAITLPATHVAWIDWPPYVATPVSFLMLIYDLRQLHRYRKENR